MASRTQLPQWQALCQHQQNLAQFSIEQDFQHNAQRAQQLSTKACDIFYDFSKQRLTQETLDKLIDLANACDLKQAITHLFSTSAVNSTENRPALHWLLRAQQQDISDKQLHHDWLDNQAVQQQMQQISEQVIHGQLRSYTGKPFTDIVNLGIGGSDLGPAMVYQALAPYQIAGIRCHYVANMCAHDLDETLKTLSPHSTLFIIASKSFTTLETMTNAETAKAWLLTHLIDKEAVANHFMAVSSKPSLAKAWGIDERFIFPFCDWVGGRYSLWSAIGLSLCLGLGFKQFKALLEGARAMDLHFQQADFRQNLPVLMALIGVWNTNFWHWPQHAIIPYDHRLRRLPAFLQQLEMESNGKGCSLNGELVDYMTCPTIWGEAGSNSQHSFFQLFHQGQLVAPIDFIAVLKAGHGKQHHQDWLFTNCLAQSRALMTGQKTSQPYQFMPGNKPSSTLLMPEINACTFGALIALYEHKVYVQSVIWQINPFDQWGVQLGKTISDNLHRRLTSQSDEAFDGSTEQLLALYQNAQ